MIVLTARSDFTFAPPPEPTAAVVLDLSTDQQEPVWADFVFNVSLVDQVEPEGRQRLTDGAVQEQSVLLEATFEGPLGVVTFPVQHLAALEWDTSDGGPTWSVTIAAQELDELERYVRGRLTSVEVDLDSPPPGLGGIGITVLLQAHDMTTHRFEQIRGGLVTESDREVLGHREMVLSGLGRWGRYDRLLGSLNLPAGHRLTHGELCRELMRSLGVPEVELVDDFGTPLLNPVELDCTGLWKEGQSVADGAGMVIVERPGRFEAIPIMPAFDATPVRVFTSSSFVAPSARITSSGDAAVCIVVTGSRVELPAGEGSGGGAVTAISTVLVFTPAFVTPSAWWRQVGSPAGNEGDLVALTGPIGDPREELISKVKTAVTTLNGCELFTVVTTWAWDGLIKRRYRQQPTAGSVPPYFSGYIFAEAAAKDDATPLYKHRSHVFRIVSIVREQPVYDPETGALLQIKKFIGGLYNTAQALRSGEQNVLATPLEGSGRGVELAHQYLFKGPRDPQRDFTPAIRPDDTVLDWLTVVTTDYTGDEEGYMTRNVETTRTWGRDMNTTWEYAGGEPSFVQFERGFDTGRVEKLFSAKGASSHVEVSTEVNVQGVVVEGNPVVATKDGYLPRLPVCSPEDRLRASNRPVKGTACAGEGIRPLTIEEIVHPYVETDDGAVARADLELAVDTAPTVTGTVPAQPHLRYGDPVVVHLPDALIYHRLGWVAEAQTALTDGRVLTDLVIKLRPKALED